MLFNFKEFLLFLRNKKETNSIAQRFDDNEGEHRHNCGTTNKQNETNKICTTNIEQAFDEAVNDHMLLLTLFYLIDYKLFSNKFQMKYVRKKLKVSQSRVMTQIESDNFEYRIKSMKENLKVALLDQISFDELHNIYFLSQIIPVSLQEIIDIYNIPKCKHYYHVVKVFFQVFIIMFQKILRTKILFSMKLIMIQ